MGHVMSKPDIIVVGAGVFGLTAALSLAERGHQVQVLDPGPIPHPLASSTDISKVVRSDYGPDRQYARLAELARAGWKVWNESLFERELYHEVGVLLLSAKPMAPGSFEYESFQVMSGFRQDLMRLNADQIASLFQMWRKSGYVDGYLNPGAGYVESGNVVAALAQRASKLGIRLEQGVKVVKINQKAGRVGNLLDEAGNSYEAERVLVAAGAWTPGLVPSLKDKMKIVGQPVFHLSPAHPEPFEARQFPVFTADVSETGWYGFPYHPHERVVKLGNHGAGTLIHPDNGDRVVSNGVRNELRRFLSRRLPALADARTVYTRLCLYCDTIDEHFWIGEEPDVSGLFVAAGGSGHGFKFAPVLGGLIADAVERIENPELTRFGWREFRVNAAGEEAARFHG
jgi:glycine/D-amino acid oxidase-like deaminating enzyme